MTVRLFGRSSSHFTRTTRIIAHECGVAYEFRTLLDLMSQTPADYGGNPALRLPVLTTEGGAWFGTLNVCRELARRAARPLPIVWPEQMSDRNAVNAQELVLQGMGSEVLLIMNGKDGRSYSDKARVSLSGSLAWLEHHLPDALQSLPSERALSFLEVSAYCFLTHLEFRSVADTSGYSRLRAFCREFGERDSVRSTAYKFDSA